MEKKILEEGKSDEDREKGGVRESRTLTYFAPVKKQVWQWVWARQLQQAAFSYHSPFINCYLAALRSHELEAELVAQTKHTL